MSIKNIPVEVLDNIFSLTAEWMNEALMFGRTTDGHQHKSFLGPYELDGPVLQYHLNSAMRVCKAWYDMTRPHRYRSIVLRSVDKLSWLSYHLRRFQHLAVLIQEIHLNWSNNFLWRMSERWQKMEWERFDDSLVAILAITPRLQVLIKRR